jgi:hypothetical protein
VSRQLVGKVEAGEIATVQIDTVSRLAEALGASLDVALRWHGEGLDRLLDAAHAGLVESVVRRLTSAGWITVVEASFSIRGERGSIDVLAHHRPTAAVLVVEVKSVVPDSQATIHGLDRKARLARQVADSHGWPCARIGRLLVVGESRSARARIAQLEGTYRVAFPDRSRTISRWLREPDGPLSGLAFLPFATGDGRIQRTTGRQRVRRASTPPAVATDASEASPARTRPLRVAIS